jgi:hypothetical protein
MKNKNKKFIFLAGGGQAWQKVGHILISGSVVDVSLVVILQS